MVKRLATFLLILILGVSFLSGCTGEQDTAEDQTEDNYIPVEVDIIAKDTLFNTSTFSGKVFANKDIMVMPKIIGKVQAVAVNVGDQVKKDEVLFTLDKEDVEKQVDQARVAYETAKSNFDLNKERIENAKTNLERTKQLYEQGAISKAQLEQAQLAASDKSLEAAQKGVEQAKLGYNQAKDALANLTVKAPIAGTVASVNVEEGEFAANSQPAMTIIDLSRVYVQISATEDIINELHKDKEVLVKIPSTKEEAIEGKIDNVSPASDPRTQLYPVKIYVDNSEDLIKPGFFAQVEIKTDIQEGVIAVRSDAVVEREGKFYIYVIDGDQAIEKEVETGLDTGNYIEITSGLNEGEKVIVKGQNYVENGSIVKVVRGE